MIALAISLSVVGCCKPDDDDDSGDDDAGDDDDDTEPTGCDWAIHDPLIASGKELLGNGQATEGYEAFADALTVCEDSVDARMGLALACQMQLEREVYILIDFLLSVIPEANDDKSFGSTLQTTLLNHLFPKALEMLGHAKAVRAAPVGWSFYLEKYPFMVEGEFEDRVILDMGGEWDHADAVIMEAEAEFYSSLILSACSYDLTLDWYWVKHFPDVGMTNPLDPAQWLALIHGVTGWLLDVIDDVNYPTFLLLRGELGVQFMTDAGYSTGSWLTLLNEAAGMMLLETDDQTDDVSGYVDENQNGQWDEGETYKLPYIGRMTTDQNLVWLGLIDVALSAGYSAWDGGEMDVDPEVENEVLLSEFNFFLEALGLEAILPPIGFNIGPKYNDPQPEQLKESLRNLSRFLYGATEPADQEVM